MFAAAICVSILLGVLVWALPGRLCDRRATHADVLAGPGIVLAVWIIAACVFAQAGLAQVFDLFLGDDLQGRKDYIAENGQMYLELADIS